MEAVFVTRRLEFHTIKPERLDPLKIFWCARSALPADFDVYSLAFKQYWQCWLGGTDSIYEL